MGLMWRSFFYFKNHYMNKQKKVFSVFVATTIILGLLSCNSEKRVNKNFNYFTRGLDSIKSVAFVEPKLKINDILKIQVIAGSIRQEDAALFNTVSGGNTTQFGVMTYSIDDQGNIEMPKIGKINAVNITAKQLADTIQKKLENEVKNPLVIVIKFVKLKINVLGEVRKPGVANFFKENVSILDVIAEAGDLNENGKREDILVMRKIDEKYETYKLDLRNTAFFNSPAFYLQDNDVVYVGANRSKLLTVGRDPNADRNISLTLQILSTVSVLLNTYVILKRL